MNLSNWSTEALKDELRRREAQKEDSDDDLTSNNDPRGVPSRSKKRHRSASPDRLARSARRDAAALKEELRRREAQKEDSDDDSLYNDPKGVPSRPKKRHRSASPDRLARSARRDAAVSIRTKLADVWQEEKDLALARKLQADENASFTTSQKQWNDPRFGTKSRPIDLDRTSSPFQGRTATMEDSDPDDAAIARQLHREELQAQEARLRAAASLTRDCAVCGESTPIISLPSLSSCTHEAQTCSNCYATWISSRLEESGWQEVKCPGTSCRTHLTHEEIKAYATQEVFERYDTLQTRGVLSLDPNFRWCRAQGCTSGQIHDAREVGNVFTCIECGARFCTVHEGAYHEGESCREYEYRTSGQKERDEREKEMKASEDALGKLSKRCPNEKCRSPIQKNGGCNHITCKSAFYTRCISIHILTLYRLEV
jgi:hypothetical protein